MDKDEIYKEFIVLQVNKTITKLFKAQLDNLEDIKLQNEMMLAKVSLKTSPEYVASINSLDKHKFDQMRKRVLDAGNDSIREIQNILDVFKYEVSEEKLAEYIKPKRRIIKKKICSGGIIIQDKGI